MPATTMITRAASSRPRSARTSATVAAAASRSSASATTDRRRERRSTSPRRRALQRGAAGAPGSTSVPIAVARAGWAGARPDREAGRDAERKRLSEERLPESATA